MRYFRTISITFYFLRVYELELNLKIPHTLFCNQLVSLVSQI